MMKIEVDWSKAPEGTTHYGPETSLYLEAWYKEVGGSWMCWLVDGGHGWYYTDSLPSNAIARPVEWDGTGLPPVGTKCEVKLLYADLWHECTVVAHFEGRAVVVLGNHESACIYAEQLRPIRTPEQIAAEKREREINDLVEVIVTHYEYPKGAESYIGLARALHNAGYRKTEQEKNSEHG